MTFEDVIAPVLGIEGRYSNDPADRGGETMWGITSRVARAFGYGGLMREMPRDVALAIYRERYFTQPHFDEVANISPAIGMELVEQGVNLGTGWPSRFLQRALNVLNRGGKDYEDLAVDGVLGKMSLRTLTEFLAVRGDEGERVLLKMLNALQSVRYIEIAEADPSQEANEYGWQRARVA